MPTTTWRVARDEISRPLGFTDFATTTNIAADNSVVSTTLSARFTQDDFFNGWWLVLEADSDGGTPANGLTKVRRVTDYTGSSGTLTVSGAAWSAEDEAVDCALHLFSPDDIQRAFNRARQNVFPLLAIVRDIDTVVTGQRQHFFTLPTTIRRVLNIYLGPSIPDPTAIAENLFVNSGFETWSDATTPGTWTGEGASFTMNQEEETTSPKNYMVLTGANSLRGAVPSTTLCRVQQTVTPDVAAQGVEANAGFWVYTRVASRISVQIGDGETGTAHSGTGWEFIKHGAVLGATVTTVADAGVVASSGAAMALYVDHGILTLGQSEIWEAEWIPIENYLWLPSAAGASDGGTLRFEGRLPEKRRLRIVALDLLSSVSADTDTFEINGDLLEPLYDRTRQYLCEERAAFLDGDSRKAWLDRAAYHRALADAAFEGGVRVLMPPKRLRTPDMGF